MIWYAHETHCPDSGVSLSKASVAHSSYEDKVENQFLIARHHSLCMVI